MSSSGSGFDSFLGAMRGAEDRHVGDPFLKGMHPESRSIFSLAFKAATYYCFGTDNKDKLINPGETFNQRAPWKSP